MNQTLKVEKIKTVKNTKSGKKNVGRNKKKGD